MLALSACSADPGAREELSEAPPGQIAVSLDVGPGLSIDSAAYTIVGPQAFSKTGALDVSDSSKLSALIGGIPADTGFSITLTASAADGKVTCSGSAPFAVSAGSTTPV